MRTIQTNMPAQSATLIYNLKSMVVFSHFSGLGVIEIHCEQEGFEARFEGVKRWTQFQF